MHGGQGVALRTGPKQRRATLEAHGSPSRSVSAKFPDQYAREAPSRMQFDRALMEVRRAAG